MMPLIFIGVAFLLLAGFFALTEYETRQGVRVFAQKRDRLDQVVARTTFVLRHADWGTFIRTEMRLLISRASHDIAHLSLQAVRAVERLLTRLVRYLRSRHAAHTAPRENVREFVRTLSDFKDTLRAPYPEITEAP